MNTYFFVSTLQLLGVVLFFAFILLLALKLLRNAKDLRKPNNSILLITQNCEENIEGFLRCLDYSLMKAEIMEDTEMIIVDNISFDHTPSIIDRLVKQYKYLKFLKLANPIDNGRNLEETINDLCCGKNVYAFSITSKESYSICGEIIKILRKKKENNRVLNNYT